MSKITSVKLYMLNRCVYCECNKRMGAKWIYVCYEPCDTDVTAQCFRDCAILTVWPLCVRMKTACGCTLLDINDRCDRTYVDWRMKSADSRCLVYLALRSRDHVTSCDEHLAVNNIEVINHQSSPTRLLLSARAVIECSSTMGGVVGHTCRPTYIGITLQFVHVSYNILRLRVIV